MPGNNRARGRMEIIIEQGNEVRNCLNHQACKRSLGTALFSFVLLYNGRENGTISSIICHYPCSSYYDTCTNLITAGIAFGV